MPDGSNILYVGNSLRIKAGAIEVGQTSYPITMVKSADIKSKEISKEGMGLSLFGAFFLAMLGLYILFYCAYLFFDSQNTIRDCNSGLGAPGCINAMISKIDLVNYVIFILAFAFFWVSRILWRNYSSKRKLLAQGAKMHDVTITTPALTVSVFRTPEAQEAEKVLGVIKGIIAPVN